MKKRLILFCTLLAAVAMQAEVVRVVADEVGNFFQYNDSLWVATMAGNEENNTNEKYVFRFYYKSTTGYGDFTEADIDMKKSYGTYKIQTDIDYKTVDLHLTETAAGKPMLVADVESKVGKQYHVVAGGTEEETAKATVAMRIDSVEFHKNMMGWIFIGYTEGRDTAIQMSAMSPELVGVYDTSEDHDDLDFELSGYSVLEKGVPVSSKTMLSGKATVSEEGRGYRLEGEMICSDSVRYLMTMHYTLPLPEDTIMVRSTRAITDTSSVGWMGLYTMNATTEAYEIELRVGGRQGYGLEPGPLDTRQMYMTMLNRKTDSTTTSLWFDYAYADRDAVGLPIVTAYVLMDNNRYYGINLCYVRPENVDTLDIVINDARMVNQLSEHIFQLSGHTDDDSWTLKMQMVSMTGVPEGSYPILTEQEQTAGVERMLDLSGTTIYSEDEADYPRLMEGGVEVRLDKDSSVVLDAEFLAIMGVEAYCLRVHMRADWADEVYYLNYDTPSGDVEDAYDEADDLTYQKYGKSVYLTIVDDEKQSAVMLQFVLGKNAAEDEIPAGVYPINLSDTVGSVMASSGYQAGSLTPSMYGVYAYNDAANAYEIDLAYFFRAGTVEVKRQGEKMEIEVDAYNSYGVNVHLVYNDGVTAIETTQPGGTVRKVLLEGRVCVESNKKWYDVSGTLVK